MKNRPTTHPETLAAQADHYMDPATGAIVPALQPSSTFARTDDYELRGPTSYQRAGTGNWDQVENVLAKLEGAEAAAAFGSGMAAAAAAVMALKPGDQIVTHDSIYWGLSKWLRSFTAKWGLSLAQVNLTDPAALESVAVPGKLKLVWIETPTNPLWEVLDIAAIAARAHRLGAKVAVDSTVATPVLTRPLALGADLVMHSATKYLGGHSDLLAGFLATREKDSFWDAVLYNRTNIGAILGPFEAWLLLRGMRTLFVRVERSCRSAQIIAEFLGQHPKVAVALYPGLVSHTGHALAKQQMQGGYSGMLSFRMKGGRDAALRVTKAVELFHRATSLGSVESLIEHRATVDGEGTTCPDDLIRLSIGLEHVDDLIADLEQALARV